MEYQTRHKVIFENDAMRVLCFKENNEHPTVLIMPAQAGHPSKFVTDFDTDKSLAQCAVENNQGGVFSIDFKGASRLRYEGITTLKNHVKMAIEVIGNGEAHLVGICQGGWLSALVATDHPDLICELTIAAAPIDTSFESIITPAQSIPLFAYQCVVGMNWGVMPGKLMLDSWKNQNKKLHAREELKPENAHFYKQYNETQDISGGWYLWCIDNIFINNRLLSMLDIKCKTNTVVGLLDDITPPDQTLSIQMCCDSEINDYEVSGGHMSTFGSREAMKPGGVWATIFKGGK